MKYKKTLIFSFCVAMVFGFASCEIIPDTPPINTVDQNKLLSINDIYQIQQDSGDNYVFTDDYMLYATVIMDDFYGNIYKEAYVQDETGGINLYKLSKAGLTRTGQYLRINLNGASLIDYSGKMEIVFDEINDVEPMLVVQENNAAITPDSISISDLASNNYECKLVEIHGLQFVDGDLNETYSDAIGLNTINRTLEDCEGNQLIIRTSGYADFAADTLPNGNGSVIGVATTFLEYNGDTTRQLLIRTPNEVVFDNARCGE